MKLKTNFCLLLLVISKSLSAGVNYYVATNGNNANNGLSTATAFKTITFAAAVALHGDTINVLAGTYTNLTYGTWNIWKTEQTIKINNKNSSSENYLVIKPYQNDKVILRGDGDFIVQIRNSSYIKFQGFEIYGEVENIPLDTGLKYQFVYRQCLNGSCSNYIDTFRVAFGTPEEVIDTMHFPVLNNTVRPTTLNNIGLVVQGSHHIEISNNIIHHNTGTGLRIFQCDYTGILENEVYENSRRSSSGNHGFVCHSATSIDNDNGYKIFIERNNVHHNYNEVYSWSEIKTFITPHIDEGKGISMQKNTVGNGWLHGKILIRNNIAHHNGFSGVHVNEGIRIDAINNTCFMNNLSGPANNEGVSVAGGEDIGFYNNIAVAPLVAGEFALSVTQCTNCAAWNNLVSGNLNAGADSIDVGTIFADPLFMDTIEFKLMSTSLAINESNLSVEVPDIDYYENTRDASPDIGATEYIAADCTLSCPSNISFSTDPNICGKILNYDYPILVGACSGYSITQVEGLASGSLFPKASTLNTFVASDGAGNSTSCSFTITILDNEAPMLTCKSNQTINIGANDNFYTIVGTEFDLSAYADNCGVFTLAYSLSGATPGSGTGTLMGKQINIGTTNVNWTVSDTSGNTTSCSLVVIIQKLLNLTCPGNQIKNTMPTNCIYQVSGTEFDAVSNGNLSYTLVGSTVGSGTNTLSNKVFLKGITTVTWTATLGNNTSTCSFTVTINDATAPTVKTKNATIYLSAAGTASLGTSAINNGSTDNCGISALSLSKTSFNCTNVGNNTVYLTVSDASLNTSSASSVVNVLDTIKPLAKCKNLTISLVSGTKTITASQLNNLSSDNCGNPMISISKSTFTCTDGGVNNVLLTATDASGNFSTCNSIVTVNYKINSSITLTPAVGAYTGGIANNVYLGYGPQTVLLTYVPVGGSGFTYQWSPSNYLINCTTCQSPTFAPTIAGNFSYTVTVTNSNGCTSSATVNMCVKDIRVPNTNPLQVMLCHNGATQQVVSSLVSSHIPGHSGDVLGQCGDACISSIKSDENIFYNSNGNENKLLDVGDHEREKSIFIYPNPSYENFILQKSQDNNESDAIYIYNIWGKLMETISISSGNETSFGQSYQNGLYIVKYRDSVIQILKQD